MSGGADGPFAVAAVDLGATSGRVMLGVVDGGRIELVPAHRFENRLVEREGHLCWDMDALWAEIRKGLADAHDLAAVRGLGRLSSIGVDSWAVDYGFVGPDGTRIGEVIAYRDARTDGAADHVAERVGREQQFALTGIAQQPFNTLYQLAVDARLEDLPPGSTLLMVPDLVGFLLTGARRTERTNASSTGMLGLDGRWSPELLEVAGVSPDLLAPLVSPGERLGTVRPELAATLGIGEVPVVAIGSHDTASAVLAVPAAPDTDPVAYISSGTWSLIGLELPVPVATEEARAAGFTNEAGVDGTVRFLKNVTGMWLVSESIRQWEEDGAQVELEELLADAASAPSNRFRIEPTDEEFLAPGRMADRVIAVARPLAQDGTSPRTPAEVVRCILESLAETYREELHAACRLAGVPQPARLHVVGGGSRNALLNQLTADALEVEVVAGPMEATALGNVALQSRTLGAVPQEPDAIRALVRESVELERFLPAPQQELPVEGARILESMAGRPAGGWQDAR